MSMEKQSFGDLIDGMSMDEILNHPDFNNLSIEKNFPNGPDYWVILFESNTKSEHGMWLTCTGQIVLHKRYRVYKTKI